MKYVLTWLICAVAIPFILYALTAFITKTSHTNGFAEFDLVIVLLGFSMTIATIVTCTMWLSHQRARS